LVGSLLGGESLLLLLSVLEELSLGSRSLRSLLLGEVSVVELGVELKYTEGENDQFSFSLPNSFIPWKVSPSLLH